VLDVLRDVSPLVSGVNQIFRHAFSESLTSGNQPHSRLPELSPGEYQVYERARRRGLRANLLVQMLVKRLRHATYLNKQERRDMARLSHRW
jgi:hypothetical protein